MAACLGGGCLFGLPRVPFAGCCRFNVFGSFPFGFDGRIWDLIVSVPDHCLSNLSLLIFLLYNQQKYCTYEEIH